MKYVIHRLCWSYEKEEKWLNEMAAKGLALVDYSFCRYLFEKCEKGEYLYRIELLENKPEHPESAAYISFMEETGVECVTTYMRWVYFRKKTADGAFDLYSDIDSKIKHYKRVFALFLWTAILEFLICLSNIIIGLIGLTNRVNIAPVNLVCAGILFALGILLIAFGLPVYKKAKRLKNERQIHE